MSMTSVAEALNAMAESWHQRLSDEQKADTEDILDTAEQFTLGALPIHEFARLSTGRMRFVALVATPREDPRREPLLRAIDAVIRFEGYIITTCGVWTPAEIGRYGGTLHSAPADPWHQAA